jgi:Homeodomain-like domain
LRQSREFDQRQGVEKGRRLRQRFPGLKLKVADRRALKAKTQGRRRVSNRVWRRIRILELLDQGWKLLNTAEAVGTYPREVRRVGWRYLERGLEAALSDDPRPKPAKLLDPRQQAAIVAMVCGPPPEGRSRWTIVLTAHEAKRRAMVAQVGRETIRRLFASHELKPWREKNVVRAQAGRGIHPADGGGVERSEPAGA